MSLDTSGTHAGTGARQAGGRRAVLAAVALLVVVGLYLATQSYAAAPAVSLAQAGDGPVTGHITESGQLPSFARLFNFSPVINGVILGLSALSLLLFLYFLLTIKSAAMMPTSFVADVTRLVINDKYEEAASLCRQHRRVFISSVILRCLENAGKEHSVIIDMIDAEGRRRADVLWNRISYLADVANVAPMLGLLGTVVGMIKAFFLIEGAQQTNIRSTTLASGVGEAMVTTMFGLVVEIITLVFYSVVKSRTTRSLADAEQVVHSISDHIKREAGPAHAQVGRGGAR